MRGRWGSGSRFSWRWRVSSSCSPGREAPAAPARPRARPRARWRSAWSCPARSARRPARSRRRPTTPPSAPASPTRPTARSSAPARSAPRPRATPAPPGVAAATSQVQSLSLFGGEITADDGQGRRARLDPRPRREGRLRGRDDLVADGARLGGRRSRRTAASSSATGATSSRSSRAPTSSSGAGGTQGFHGFVTALAVHLTAPHGELPAGSEIRIGYAEANVQASVAPAAEADRPRSGRRSSPSTQSGSRRPSPPSRPRTAAARRRC